MPFPKPPSGIKALPWRLPIYFYRSGFGWLMGDRFLLLRHRGRTSGKTRFAVLEIIHSIPEEGLYFVVSGFGTASNWYKNILRHPGVEIQIRNQQLEAQAARISPTEGAEILLGYAEKNPGSLKALSDLLGYEIDFTPEGIRDFGHRIPVIRFSAARQSAQEDQRRKKSAATMQGGTNE